jgi:thioredoxin-related protein
MKSTTTFILIAIANFAYAQGISFESHDTKWADILAKAKTENKVIFMDAYTTWCGPCKKMAADVFPQKEVGDYFNKQFINVKMDMEKGEGLDLARKYKIRAYPTYLFIDGNGELVHKSLGMMPAPEFIKVGESAADPNKQFFTLKKKFDEGENNPEVLLKMIEAARSADDSEFESKARDVYFITQKDWSTKENMALIIQTSSQIDSKTFQYLVKNRTAFEKVNRKEFVEYRLIVEPSIEVNKKFSDDKKGLDLEKAKSYLEKYLTPELAQQILSFSAIQNFEMKKDTPNYLKQTETYLDKYSTNDVSFLNNAAWNFYEKASEKTQLEKAVKWSLKSIEGFDNFMFNDTAAALYFKLKNKNKAKEHAEKAIKLAKKDGEDASETESLLKKIEAM